MKIYYDNLERGNNLYIAVPLAIETCCPDAMLWLFRYPTDLSISEQVLLKKDANGQPEVFRYCQFCGIRHFVYKIQTKEKQEEKGEVKKENEHIQEEKKT